MGFFGLAFIKSHIDLAFVKSRADFCLDYGKTFAVSTSWCQRGWGGRVGCSAL